MKSLRARRNAKKAAKQRRHTSILSGLNKFQKKNMPSWQTFGMGELISHLRWSIYIRNDEFTPEQKKTLRRQLQQCVSYLDKM